MWWPLKPGARVPGNWDRLKALATHASTAMSTLYEVALVGEFFQPDLQVILNRFTLHCESAQRMHSHEVIFEPIDAAAQRAANVAPVQLRCRRELFEPGSGWYVHI